MDEDRRTRRWEKLPRLDTSLDPLQALRASLSQLRKVPRDAENRRQLRAIATEQGLTEELATLLADEARGAGAQPALAIACYEELVEAYEALDRPLEMIGAMEKLVALVPDDADHRDRLAWLYRRAGAWQKAAESFEHVGELSRDNRARAALRAAAQLYRENRLLERAAELYRRIVERKPSDREAWRALDDVLAELGRWRELANVRAERASRAEGIEKATLLRAGARALEQAGELGAAAELVQRAAQHAPDDVSGLVDYAEVLARAGQGHEAAEVLRTRIADSVAAGVAAEDLADLRVRLAKILGELCDDRSGARQVLEASLAAVPAHVDALELLASFEPEPRARAAVLQRQAEATPDPAARAALLVEAARSLRSAGDHRAAVERLQEASELAGDDEVVRTELAVARVALLVERADAELAAGEAASAERRLRAALDAAPEDAPGVQLAPLVHRLALARVALGEHDDAHQLLHDAHRMDRDAVLITVALGESCFRRRLWRQAALHLGSLAEHPSAPLHAQEVALGLVHAGQAEVRGLRPGNAARHYEAAVRLDPACAPAWHALGELAMERGDTEEAARCLEREAHATTAPRERLRLFDALGDLVLGVLGDPARAEACWRQVAELGDLAMLGKLYELQRQRAPSGELADTCERLAVVHPDPRRRKAFLEEAARAFAAAGDVARARTAAERLLTAHPLDVDAVLCASAILLAADEAGTVRELLQRALTSWEARGDRGKGDARRAELWRRLGDAEREHAAPQAALAAYRTAVAIAPESDGAMAARRALVELAASAGRMDQTSLLVLVEAEQAPADVLVQARSLGARSVEDARAAYELARALGAGLTREDVQFLEDHPPRRLASDEAYSASLDEATRRELVDDAADAPLAEILELMAEVAPLICPDARSALFEADLADAQRLGPARESATAAIYPQIAKAFGGPPTLLYVAPRTQTPLQLLLSSPPVVVLGAPLARQRPASRLGDERDTGRELSDEQRGDAALRFQLGRIVELTRPRRIFAAGQTPEQFERFVQALWHLTGRTPVPRTDVIDEAERLRGRMPVALRQRLAEKLTPVSLATLDLGAYIDGCQRAADRVGLLACGDIGVALDLAGGAEAAPHLVRLASTQRYRQLRRKLRAR